MSKVVNIQKYLNFKTDNVQKCSFCHTERPCVSGTATGKAICTHCIQAAGEVLETQPSGSVSCLKCKQYLSFTLCYAGLVWVRFDASGLDRHYATIYLPVHVYGGRDNVWHSNMLPQKAVCNSCKATVPLDLFNRTNYINNGSTKKHNP